MTKHTQRFYLSLMLMVSFLFVGSNVWAQTVAANVDRTQIASGESFQLIFTMQGAARATTPDLSPLKSDFTIFGTSKSSQVTRINGKITAGSQWIVTLSPNRTGHITIPAIRFGNVYSKPINIQVLVGSKSANQGKQSLAFLEVNADSKVPYVQSQLLYNVKLYYATSIANGKLTDPASSNAIIMRMGIDQHYQVKRDGRMYQVLERDYAIFPQTSGNLIISPPVFTGVTEQHSRHFAHTHFTFNTQGTPLRLLGKNIEINVKPIPEAFRGQSWLPAKQVTINESWSQSASNFRIGEPITRTITIRATGLTAAQIPNLNVPKITGFNAYTDKAEAKDLLQGGNITGIRSQKITYIPTQGGKKELPALQVHWWNTVTNRAEVAELPQLQLNVPFAANQTASPSSASTPVASASTVSRKINPPTLVNKSRLHDTSFWPWVAGIFLLAWLMTLMIWFIKKRLEAREKQLDLQLFPLGAQSLRQAHHALKHACHKDDAKIAERELLHWAQIHWQDKNIAALGLVAKLITSAELIIEVNKLNKHLYSDKRGTWKGKTFWNAFVKFQEADQVIHKMESDNLPPLHPVL